jgi:SAM-dependent methyltransferase
VSQLSLNNPGSVKDYLLSFDLFKDAAWQEGINYLNDAFQRLMTTLSLVPRFPEDRSPRLLELGANPYFMTLLLKQFRPKYDLHLANYFGSHFQGLEHEQTITSEKYGESHRFVFRHFNTETENFPYPDGYFDFVLYCEIIEHLTQNPARALVEIHRILKPGGQVLITTPNVLRLQNVVALLRQENTYDPYSGYGPYGRHNREYTSQELVELVQGCGFDLVQLVMAEKYVHPIWQKLPRRMWRRFRDNIYLVAKTVRPRSEYHPVWLYRSFY